MRTRSLTAIVCFVVLILQSNRCAGQQYLTEYRMKNQGGQLHQTNAPFNLPSQKTGHFWGRYIVNTMASTAFWSLSVATISLIDNGTIHPSREWFEDNALVIARPSIVLASSTFSMLLYDRINLRAFLTTTAINSTLLLGVHFGGKLLSDELNSIVQITTTFFLVPFTATLYHHILSTKKSGIKLGRVNLNLMTPSVRKIDNEPVPGINFLDLRW